MTFLAAFNKSKRRNIYYREKKPLPEGERDRKKGGVMPSDVGYYSLKETLFVPLGFIATFINESVANDELLLYLCNDIKL